MEYTLSDALCEMFTATAHALTRARVGGYTDSDYDTLENLLYVSNAMLSAHYEGVMDYLPDPSEAPWCPQRVIDFLHTAWRGE